MASLGEVAAIMLAINCVLMYLICRELCFGGTEPSIGTGGNYIICGIFQSQFDAAVMEMAQLLPFAFSSDWVFSNLLRT